MDSSKDLVDITSECFGYRDGSVLCWRGVNYTPQRTSPRAFIHNMIVRLKNRPKAGHDRQ